jgi:hypothetical protein
MGIWEKMTAQDPGLRNLPVTEQVDRLIAQAKVEATQTTTPAATASNPMQTLLRAVTA